MSDFQKNSGAGDEGDVPTPSAPRPTDLSTLFNFPTLGRLFEGTDTQPLAEMRARLESTRQEIERVVRQGSKEDAARAARANEAYKTALSLLDKLEEIRRQQAS